MMEDGSEPFLNDGGWQEEGSRVPHLPIILPVILTLLVRCSILVIMSLPVVSRSKGLGSAMKPFPRTYKFTSRQ